MVDVDGSAKTPFVDIAYNYKVRQSESSSTRYIKWPALR